ncbi:LysR substrate-binding domain-containing protein, partial [Gillisia sp. Q332]|uniref:LysR substrate-binding domain-containing protein n=1 Tax=Gillisia xinjiangensis TaxID=3384765 RepID=UPI00391D8298
GQRGMVLTQRALELMEPLHEALEGVRRVVEQGAPINPETLRATVVIAASDYVQYALLARYSVVLRPQAPMVRIAWRALDLMALTTQLERGEVDLALARPEEAPAAMRQRRLYEEEYVVVARQEHPAVRGVLDLDLFCALDHVVVSKLGGGFAGPTDAALEAIGHRR